MARSSTTWSFLRQQRIPVHHPTIQLLGLKVTGTIRKTTLERRKLGCISGLVVIREARVSQFLLLWFLLPRV
jgi:hypothetical protein